MTWDRSLRSEIAAEFRAAALRRHGSAARSDEATPPPVPHASPASSRPRRLITHRPPETP